LTVEQIEARFPSEWVLIGDPRTDESQRLLAGTVLFHSPDRDEVDRRLLDLRGRFDLGHQQQVEDAELLALPVDDHGPPGRRHGQEVRVRDVERAAVGHVDGEGTERRRAVGGAELLDRHPIGPRGATALRRRRVDRTKQR
jgi:hypothetical protein